jgi:hypothetical protein
LTGIQVCLFLLILTLVTLLERSPAGVLAGVGSHPSFEERAEALRARVLDGLAAGEGVLELRAALAALEDRRWVHPARPLLELAAAALARAVADRNPVPYAGLRERYLPEVPFAGRAQHRNSQYMLYAAAVLRGGVEPDLDRDAGWWGAPGWEYALCALVIYLRVAAERTGHTVPQLVEELRHLHSS